MTTPSITTTCLTKELIANQIYECRFSKPEGFSYKPGQFLLIDFPLIEDESDIQPRAYSIASSPDEEDFLFVFKLEEGGRASRWIEQRMQPGDDFRAVGPMGLFTLPDDSEDTAFLFLCTSTGLAPFRPQIMELLKRDPDAVIDLMFSCRGQEDLFWMEEFESLQSTHKNFHLHITLSQLDDSWDGLSGRIQEHLPDLIPDFPSRSIFACGNPAMTTDIRKKCLEEWGVKKEQVHTEGYV